MNLDVAGPLQPGTDIDEQAKFMLLGTCTWLKSKKARAKEEKARQVEEDEEEDMAEDLEEQGPILENEAEVVEEAEDEIQEHLIMKKKQQRRL